MDFPDDLRYAEASLIQAEKEFLAGDDGVAEALLERLATGTFSSDVETAREQMQKLDESRYVKWNRWEKRFVFAASFWKDEGYPSIDTTTHQASKPDWYSQRTETTSFVKDLMTHRNVKAPTADGEQKGTPTPPGNPSNRWLLDFVALSSLRLSFKNHWEKLVRDIVRKRPKTNLELVAERLGLTIPEVIDIARKIRDLDESLFGEGITVLGDRIYQLTYKSQVGFIYDRSSFQEIQKIYYQNREGWGLTHNGRELIMSDGSNVIYFLDPEMFTINRQIEVYTDEGPAESLNELEYIKGKIWANRYYTDEIVIIDPLTGKVEGRINLKGILKASDRKASTNVLNGIAWDEAGDRIFVTGKFWPKLFEIRLRRLSPG